VCDCCAVIYAEIQRDVPTTLAAWEEVEAKFKSNGVTATSQPAVRTLNEARMNDEDEFISLSQQLHTNLAPSSASTTPPMTSNAIASNGGMQDFLVHLSSSLWCHV